MRKDEETILGEINRWERKQNIFSTQEGMETMLTYFSEEDSSWAAGDMESFCVAGFNNKITYVHMLLPLQWARVAVWKFII